MKKFDILDHAMDINDRKALTGITLDRYLINDELSHQIRCLLRHGDQYPIAMGAYGYVMLGDLAQYSSHRFRHESGFQLSYVYWMEKRASSGVVSRCLHGRW